MTERPRIVVTGGAGFIGAHLVHHLAASGARVWVYDNFSVGRRATLDPVIARYGCEVIAGDVTDAPAVQALVATVQPHRIFHLAAIHFVPQCEREPVAALATNVLGTQAVLGAAEFAPGCRVVFASTGDVYAASDAPHGETSPIGPLTLYGLTKVSGEHLVRRAVRRGTDARIARLFNVFGPGDRTPHVLPDILSGLANGGPLALGCLDAVRDYVYVEDVVRALVALARYEGDERVFNIGTGEGRTVRELVDAVVGAWGQEVTVVTDPAKLRPIERPVLVANACLARVELAWTPRTSFANGIAQLMAASCPALVR